MIVDGLGFSVYEEAGQVEAVDVIVLELRIFELVADTGHVGADENFAADVGRSAHDAGQYQLADLLDLLDVAAVLHNEIAFAGLVNSLQHVIDLVNGEGHGFFAQHVVTRFEGGGDNVVVHGNVGEVDQEVALLFCQRLFYGRVDVRLRREVVPLAIIFCPGRVFLRDGNDLAVVSFGDVIQPAERDVAAACHNDPELFHNFSSEI